MPERKRATFKGDVVTIIKVHGKGRNAKVDIRNTFGFPQTVHASELKPIDADEPIAAYSFGESE